MSPVERTSFKLAPALLAMALYAAGARADEAETPRFSFGGFGTVGVVHSSEKNADFTSGIYRPNGAGHTHAWSADADSRIGAQLTATLSPRLSAVLQVISEQNYDDTYRPHVEWANLKYQFTPDFSVRAGRTVLPIFLLSEVQNVGYANPWVRPPLDFYSLVPIDSSDGVDASYRAHFDKLASTFRFTHGRSFARFPSGTAKTTDGWGISNTSEYGAFTAHASYFKARTTFSVYKPLFDGFRQFGAEGIALADRYEPSNTAVTFFGLGATYDPGKWFVTGERGFVGSDSVLGKRSAWYASGGYRMGKLTPYVTYARRKSQSDTSDPGLTLSALPPSLAGRAAALNAGLNAGLGSVPVQATLSFGTRWDFAKNAALKLQLDHIRLGDGSVGTLINVQPGFQAGGKVNVFSSTVDFVF